MVTIGNQLIHEVETLNKLSRYLTSSLVFSMFLVGWAGKPVTDYAFLDAQQVFAFVLTLTVCAFSCTNHQSCLFVKYDWRHEGSRV
jgi:hypothetical protein